MSMSGESWNVYFKITRTFPAMLTWANDLYTKLNILKYLIFTVLLIIFVENEKIAEDRMYMHVCDRSMYMQWFKRYSTGIVRV